MSTEPWRNRIVGHGDEPPEQLLANPKNWRLHPKKQQDALAGALAEVGWVQNVIVNQRTGHVVDGHLRVELAISRQEPSVPVVYVDLDEREEAIILASIDPLSAMAGRDDGILAQLMEGLEVGDTALAAMLQLAGASDPGASSAPEFQYQEKYAVTVMCASAVDQERIYGELMGRGYECRVVVV